MRCAFTQIMGYFLCCSSVYSQQVSNGSALFQQLVAAGGEQSASTTEAASGTTDTTAAGTADTSVATTDTTAAGTTDTTTDDRGAFEPRPNAQVRVQVANTTAVAGAAGGQTDDFKALGYVTLKPTNSASGQARLNG